jgi:hypothetical protein
MTKECQCTTFCICQLIRNFDDLIELEHGKLGTESRNEYEERAQMFIVSVMTFL